MPNKKFDIYDRAFNFAVRAVKFINQLPKNLTLIEYTKQLTRSTGSIGANLEEADGALTKKDFINKIGIARREAKESRHWLKLIKATYIPAGQLEVKELDWLIQESTELLLILSSIVKNAQNKNE
jgi:four helix bundle protein